MKTTITIDRHAVLRNSQTGSRDKVIQVDGEAVCNGLHIPGPCRIVYDPDKPFGPKVWIEVEGDIEMLS